MANSAIKKVNKITQIVRLKQFVQRWKTKSLDGYKPPPPPGTIAVYVGPERCRFVIPARYLNLPIFVGLLHRAEEEFGFQTSGGLILPCDSGIFREMLNYLAIDDERFGRMKLDDFLQMISEVDFEPFDQSSNCKGSDSSSRGHGFESSTPLLLAED